MRNRFVILSLLISATAYAGFLPLLQDRPKRDNPNDPAVKPLTGPAVVFPTLTFTPTPLPSCSGSGADNSKYNFESCAGAWTYETFAGYEPFTAQPSLSGPSCFGSLALQGSLNLTHSPSDLHFAFKLGYSGAGENWSGRSLIARFYAPAGYGASRAAIYVKSGPSYSFSNGPFVTALPGGWVSLTYDLGGLATANAIREVGIDVFSANPDPNGPVTYRVDAFDLLGGPVPLPTSTPSISCGVGQPDTSNVGNFESGTETWTYEAAGGYTPLTIGLGATYCLGSQALSGTVTHTCSDTKASFKKNLASLNWAGQTLEARLYVPAGSGGVTADLYVKTGAGYAWFPGAAVKAAGGAWTSLTYDLSTVATANDVREVGVDLMFDPPNTAAPVSYYLDAVRVYP